MGAHRRARSARAAARVALCVVALLAAASGASAVSLSETDKRAAHESHHARKARLREELAAAELSTPLDGEDGRQAVDDDSASTRPSMHNSLLVATGSADSCAYLFDISGPAGSGELLQRLSGHSDRVYATDFHPSEPILATASADFMVKIWYPARAQPRRHVPPRARSVRTAGGGGGGARACA